jgi:TPR repeat protein
VQQGDKVLAQGNIASARQFYLRAADAGLGAAAMKLAQTYDPVVLAGLAIQGLTGDVREARLWYQRAADLGETAATDALKRLDGR